MSEPDVPEVPTGSSEAANGSLQGGIVDEHVFLVGRPPVEEFLGYVGTQSIGAQEASLPSLLEQWRKANDRVRQLEVDEAGLANDVPIGPLPAETAAQVQRVVSDPIFQRQFSMAPTEIGLVELDRLVVFQKDVNLRYVAELVEQLGPDPSPEAIFRFALSYDHPVPSVGKSRLGQSVFVFKSRSADFRFLEAVLLSPTALPGYQPAGPVAAIVGLVVGHGSNYFNALGIEGRLVLNNGSHRAYALRSLGITHAPCVVQQLTRRDELSVLGNAELAQHADRYLSDPRPPLLKDYFDPALKVTVPVPRQVCEVRVSFGFEALMVPA